MAHLDPTTRSRLGIFWRMRGEVQRPVAYPQFRLHMAAVCKTVGSAYVGSNPTPATTCENGPLARNSRLCGPFLLCPVVCHLVALRAMPLSLFLIMLRF
jgi:hypothetical protein